MKEKNSESDCRYKNFAVMGRWKHSQVPEVKEEVEENIFDCFLGVMMQPSGSLFGRVVTRFSHSVIALEPTQEEGI